MSNVEFLSTVHTPLNIINYEIIRKNLGSLRIKSSDTYIRSRSLSNCLLISYCFSSSSVSIEYRHLLKVETNNTTLTIYYVIRKKAKTLKMKTLTIKGPEKDIHMLCADIENRLQGMFSFCLIHDFIKHFFMLIDVLPISLFY